MLVEEIGEIEMWILALYEYRDGESIYSAKRLLEVADGQKITEVIDEYLRDMWGNETEKLDEGVYWNGQVAVKARGWRKVRKEHVKILRKYGI